ncbi:MAG: hypothetical protein ABJL72_12295 [Roseobacter sp.]
MISRNFRVAMRNQLSLGPFHTPSVVANRTLEWLIVERSDRFLAISDAGTLSTQDAANPNASAPDALARNNTLLGTFIEQHVLTGDDIFLLSQFPILTALPIGKFFPGEGYARISAATGQISLTTRGRHFHIDPPHDAPFGTPPLNGGDPGQSGGGINWQFNAVQRPWIGEQTS